MNTQQKLIATQIIADRPELTASHMVLMVAAATGATYAQAAKFIDTISRVTNNRI